MHTNIMGLIDKTLSRQRFGPGLAVRVKVRPLTNTDRTVPESLPKAFIIKSSRVESAPVIPDSYRALEHKINNTASA